MQIVREVRAEERFAGEVLRQVLRARVTEWDTNAQPGMVDALFELPDGRLGALEVTTLGDEAELKAENLGRKLHGMIIAGARLCWVLMANAKVIPSKADLEVARASLTSLILRCEAEGVSDPRSLRFAENQEHPGYAWWWRVGQPTLFGIDCSRPGAVDVLPDIGSGGAVPSTMNGFVEWADAALEAPLLRSKLEKLERSGRPERHLFVRLHDSADVPFAIEYALSFTTMVPEDGLTPPSPLEGFWICPRWQNPILWWGARSGWRRENIAVDDLTG